jgi:leucyl/phenylalanyl-tRNA--protein transferase
VIPWLDDCTPFPPVSRALTEPNGLLAAGGDLSPARLIEAYRRGIFPWYSEHQPILWWSPDPRMVVIPGEFSPRRSLVKVLRNRAYEIRCDTAFEQVVRACAATPRKGQDGTWITDDVMRGYCALHAAGHAHSVETWIDGRLAGGLYGVNLGRAFYGESMFSHAPEASKIAFAHLAGFLHEAGCGIIDCQMKTSHLATLGAREIPRSHFSALLAEFAHASPITGWAALSRRWHPVSAA